jgi:DnaK suppressor protein
MARKNYFTKKELSELKSLLEEKRASLLEEITRFEAGVRDGATLQSRGDEADRAASEIDGTFRIRMQDKNRKLLNEIVHALSKFKDGSYGICEGTEEYIAKARLKIRPWTRYSIEYKEYADEMKRKGLPVEMEA